MFIFLATSLFVLGAASGQVVQTTEECSPICTYIYDPVCSQTGDFFANPCTMEYVACITGDELVGTPCYPVECHTYDPDGVCTMEWNPVCDLDGNMYGNPCQMLHYACSRDLQLYMVECDFEDAKKK